MSANKRDKDRKRILFQMPDINLCPRVRKVLFLSTRVH